MSRCSAFTKLETRLHNIKINKKEKEKEKRSSQYIDHHWIAIYPKLSNEYFIADVSGDCKPIALKQLTRKKMF